MLEAARSPILASPWLSLGKEVGGKHEHLKPQKLLQKGTGDCLLYPSLGFVNVCVLCWSSALWLALKVYNLVVTLCDPLNSTKLDRISPTGTLRPEFPHTESSSSLTDQQWCHCFTVRSPLPPLLASLFPMAPPHTLLLVMTTVWWVRCLSSITLCHGRPWYPPHQPRQKKYESFTATFNPPTSPTNLHPGVAGSCEILTYVAEDSTKENNPKWVHLEPDPFGLGFELRILRMKLQVNR